MKKTTKKSDIIGATTDELVVNLHGDIGLYPVNNVEPPKKMTKKIRKHLNLVIESSTVSGNSHIVRAIGGVHFWHWFTSEGDEMLYCPSEYTICHEGPDCEHGVQRIQPGVRQVKREQEHNPVMNELQRVID
jgi:hypothetical protein